MDQDRFDALTRRVAHPATRRSLAGLLVAGTLGAFGLGDTVAKTGNKGEGKGRKLRRNEFGCVNVGNACRGNDAACCSGACEGKKPKKGEKDTSRCVARNVLDCAGKPLFCTAPLEDSFCNREREGLSACWGTTGKALFCGDMATFDRETSCHKCRKDTDCEDLGFPPGSACILIPNVGECGDGCLATDRRACMAPSSA
jgi:hypothetical protein